MEMVCGCTVSPRAADPGLIPFGPTETAGAHHVLAAVIVKAIAG